MKIALASDVVSPFCWMACQQVEYAMAQFPEVEFELELMPFQVTPGLPLDYTFERYQREHMTLTFGNMAAVKDMLRQVTAMGAEHGCEFNLDKLTVWPNSRRAHGLWALGETPEQRWKLHKDLCQAHFQHGQNLNDIELLAEIGERHGLVAEQVKSTLRDEAYIDKILMRVEQTRQLGINSVPTLILNDQYRVQGAQGREQLAATIEQILANN